MSNKKLQKQKDREKKVKAKLLLQRKVITKERQKQAGEFRDEKIRRKEIRLHDRMDDMARDLMANFDKLPEATRKQIEHNIEILGALQDEWQKEQDARVTINEKLEAAGHTTLRDKLEALSKRNQAAEQTVTPSGEAECAMQTSKNEENSDHG